MSADKKTPIVLVLCGGDGTRLGRFGELRHKCLLPVDDGDPIFARHVRAFPPSWRVFANVPAKWEHAYTAHKRALGLKNLTLVPITSPPRGSGATLSILARENPGRDVFVCYGDTWLSREWYDAACTCPRDRTWVGGDWLHAGEPVPTSGVLVSQRRRDGAQCLDRASEHPRSARAVRAATHWHVGVQHYSAQDAAHVAGMKGSDLDVMSDVLPRVLARARTRGREVYLMTAERRGANSVADLGTLSRYVAYCVRTHVERIGFPKSFGSDAYAAEQAVVEARRIVTAGNGGACAVAQHAAIDWAKSGGRDVTALGDAVSMSAWANDYGYEGALARQVERVRDPQGCALVLFSASGSSPNVVEAAKRARECGYGAVVSVSHADSTALLHAAATARVQLPFGRPCGVRGYGEIEDAMSVWCHAVTAAMAGLSPWQASEAEGAR